MPLPRVPAPLAWALPLCMAALVGCGPDRPATTPVSGVVLFKGEPVSDATVVMMVAGGGRPATGVTDAEGRFTLTTFAADDGAMLGEHAVTVVKKQLDIVGVAPAPAVDDEAGRDALSNPALGLKTKETWFLPKRYANPQTSGLTIRVEPGMEPVTLELTP